MLGLSRCLHALHALEKTGHCPSLCSMHASSVLAGVAGPVSSRCLCRVQAAAGRALFDTAVMDRSASASGGGGGGGAASAALLERTQVITVAQLPAVMRCCAACCHTFGWNAGVLIV